jgi:folate-binding protein YgfZ
LRSTGAAAWLARDVVAATGPEAGDFLQGQLSQDVAALASGSSAWSWVLQPTGKVDALVRVTRLDDGWLLDTDAGWGEALVARLGRFKLRTKVDLEFRPWRVLAVRGSNLGQFSADVVVDGSWPGLPGVDLLGENPAVPDQLPLAAEAEYEAARIEAGIPRMGAELTEKTIPAETGLVARTVSFTKGCYTGQELVARIDSRGSHVPRSLRGLRLGGPVEPGADLVVEGKTVGTVTSVAESPAHGWVGLGYTGRAVEPPARVAAGPEEVPAEVVALPSD